MQWIFFRQVHLFGRYSCLGVESRCKYSNSNTIFVHLVPSSPNFRRRDQNVVSREALEVHDVGELTNNGFTAKAPAAHNIHIVTVSC